MSRFYLLKVSAGKFQILYRVTGHCEQEACDKLLKAEFLKHPALACFVNDAAEGDDVLGELVEYTGQGLDVYAGELNAALAERAAADHPADASGIWSVQDWLNSMSKGADETWLQIVPTKELLVNNLKISGRLPWYQDQKVVL